MLGSLIYFTQFIYTVLTFNINNVHFGFPHTVYLAYCYKLLQWMWDTANTANTDQAKWQSCGFTVQCQKLLSKSKYEVHTDKSNQNHILSVNMHSIKFKHLLSEMQCKKYRRISEKYFSLSTYCIDLISYSYASCRWWNKPRGLCVETEEEPHTWDNK